MISRIRSVTLAYAVLVSLETGLAAAQNRSPCPPAPALEATETSTITKIAINAFKKILAGLGFDVNVKQVRNSVLKDHPNVDQAIVVLTMAHTYCEMIWAEPSLDGAQKSQRLNEVMTNLYTHVSGSKLVATTLDDNKGLYNEETAGPDAHITVDQEQSSSSGSAPVPTEEVINTESNAIPARQLPPSTFSTSRLNTEPPAYADEPAKFLRERPFYVTDANKYFVIVGSVHSRQEGVKLMYRFKERAPEYDFALYEPYGNNSYYAIMMATWVPRNVAYQALKLARRDVVHDAYVWTCRSLGESC